MFYDASKRDHGLPQDPLKALIGPRPIGWISTVDGQGRVKSWRFTRALVRISEVIAYEEAQRRIVLNPGGLSLEPAAEPASQVGRRGGGALAGVGQVEQVVVWQPREQT